jgi:hypothetical protein
VLRWIVESSHSVVSKHQTQHSIVDCPSNRLRALRAYPGC